MSARRIWMAAALCLLALPAWAQTTSAVMQPGAIGDEPLEVTLTQPTNGQQVVVGSTIPMWADASDLDDNIQQVAIYVDGVMIGSASGNSYIGTWVVTAGSHGVRARATNDHVPMKTAYTPTITISGVANTPPTVSLTGPANGAIYTVGATVPMTATASDNDGTINRVEFLVDGNEVGEAASSPYNYSWTATIGTHTVQARAVDNLGATKTTPAVNITITNPPPAPGAITRTYTYNSYQELCSVDEPETGATLMGYDAAANLAWSASGLAADTACDAEGDTAAILARKAVRTYDARNRISTLTFPDANGNQSWSYTPDSLPASVTTYNDAGATTVVNAYAYNKRRMLTAETSGQPGWYSWAIGYGYDANGHLASQSYPDGGVVGYAPNALGQPTQAGTYATDVSYYPNGAIAAFTYGNGIVHSLAQNARGLPDRSRDADGATSIHDDSYGYDQDGNVVAILDGVPGNGGDRTMLYDGLNRLTDVASPMYGTTGAHYTYDVLDNITSVTAPSTAGVLHAYCYDANRLTTVKIGSCGGATVMSLGYDVQGNLSNKNGALYTFDYGNRLRGAAGLEGYRYDALGRRVLAWSPTQGNILSVYGQGGQLLFQQNQRSQNNMLDYIYVGGSLVAIRTYNSTNGVYTTTYQHTDALGSPVATTNSAKTVLQRSEYEPYGYLLNRAMQDGPGYTGHVTDAATGLVYMQQRYYDPLLQRFDSVDAVTAYSSGDVRFFNRYAYVFNNPYKFDDPDGRCPTCFVGAGIGALVGGGIELLKQTRGFRDWSNLNGRAIAVETGRGAVVGGLAGAGVFGASAMAASAGASTAGVATAEVVGGAYATGVGTFVTGPASDLAKGQPEKSVPAYGREGANAAAGALAGGIGGKLLGGALAKTTAPAAAIGTAARVAEESTSAVVSNGLQNQQGTQQPPPTEEKMKHDL